MKHLVRFVFPLLFLLMQMSCNESETIPELSGMLISHSGCKNDLKAKDMATGTIADTLSCIKYSYDPAAGVLSLSHINAGFNCCPGELYCDVSLNSDTIVVEEKEKEAMCDCDCLYDLTIEVNGVQDKKYVIRFIEPYAATSAKLIFEIDLPSAQTGSCCVIRKSYPWGM